MEEIEADGFRREGEGIEVGLDGLRGRMVDGMYGRVQLAIASKRARRASGYTSESEHYERVVEVLVCPPRSD